MTADRRRRRGRLVLDDRVAAGRITIEDGRIAAVDLDDGPTPRSGAVPRRARVRRRPRPRLGRPRRDGRSRPPSTAWLGALLRRGRHVVPADRRHARRSTTWPRSPSGSARGCRTPRRMAPSRSGSNLEGPFLAPGSARRPRPRPTCAPRRDVPRARSSRSSTGCGSSPSRPSCPARSSSSPGATTAGSPCRSATRRRRRRGARRGYAAGATSTTHLFNAMTGLDHRAPGLALAALLDDAVYVELIADGIHVHPGHVAVHHRAQAAGPAAPRQRRRGARRDGRRPWPDRRPRGRGRRRRG